MTILDHQDHQGNSPTDIADPALRLEARKALIWVGIVGLVALAVLLAEPLLVVFGGMVFGALLDGGARLLGKLIPLPRVVLVMVVLILAVVFMVWTILYAGSQITIQAAELPATVGIEATRILHWAAHHGYNTSPKLLQNFSGEALASIGQITNVVGGLIGGMTTLFLILVLGIYFALDPDPYRRGLAWILPANRRGFFRTTCRDMAYTLRRLLLGRLIGMGVEGLSIGLALGIYGVPLASLLGLIAGLLAFFPNIGAPISGLLMILVGFSGGTHMGLYCIGVYVVVQGVDGNIIVPLVAKKSADLAPALVLAMQLIMGVLFGILGLALADPLLAMIKVLLERLALRDASETVLPETVLPETVLIVA